MTKIARKVERLETAAKYYALVAYRALPRDKVIQAEREYEEARTSLMRSIHNICKKANANA